MTAVSLPASPPHDSDMVSVVIPAFNAARFLPFAIASALTQTHRNLEVIVVDDGSEDDTADVARSASSGDPRVRIFRQSNQGVAAARNMGVSQAKGRFVAPLDADDVWHRRKLELQLAALKRHPGAQCCYTWQFEVDEENRVSRVMREGPRWEGLLLPLMVLENMVGCASAPLISRQALIEIGGYDESLRARGAQGCEDWKVSLLLAERYPFAVVPLALTGYRQVRRSMSTDVSGMLRSYDLVIAEIRARHPELPAHLFRWSRAKVTAWLARRAWQAGSVSAALQMTGASIKQDAWLTSNFAAQGMWMILNRASRPFWPRLNSPKFDEFEPAATAPMPHLRGRVQQRGEKVRKLLTSPGAAEDPAAWKGS